MHCGHVSLFKFSTPNKMINATIVFILILNKHLQYKTKDSAVLKNEMLKHMHQLLTQSTVMKDFVVELDRCEGKV